MVRWNRLVLCLLVAGFQAAGVAQQSTVKMTVQVLGPTTAAGKRLPKAAAFGDGNPVVSLVRTEKDSTTQVLANSVIVLSADRRATYTIDRPDVLEFDRRDSLPPGVRGVFRAKKAGTAVLTLVTPAVTYVCPPGIRCDPAWSGYVIGKASQPYTGVTGQWTVPTLASNSPQGASSSWVGIDQGATIIQAGTAQNSGEDYNPFAGISYYAWYQIFPSNEVRISKPVSPGDVIQVKIIPLPGTPTPVPSKSSPWSIQITNVTKNWFYSATENYAGILSSVEWIEESPSNAAGATTMADYEQVEFNFDNQFATGGGPLAPVQLASSEQFWMNQGGPGGIYSTPSNPSGDLQGFYVTWTQSSPNQVFPPGPWIQTTSVPPAQLNVPYSQTFVVNQATTPRWTFSGYMPTGMTFNQLTGVLAGTPTDYGNFDFSVFATDLSNGSYTSTIPLILTVNKTPSASLQVTCTEFGPVAPTGINVTVDSMAEACSTPIVMPTGLHTVVGSPFGTPGPFKVTYSGSCNAAGQVTLAQSEAATCVVAAETVSGASNACPAGQHCCEPSATGCLKCIATKMACP